MTIYKTPALERFIYSLIGSDQFGVSMKIVKEKGLNWEDSELMFKIICSNVEKYSVQTSN
jgi:hypothetical protein